MKGELKGILEEAIYKEIEARNFYKRMAQTIENTEGKKKFEQLANDEDGHREKLSSWYVRLFSEEFVEDNSKVHDSEAKFFELKDSASAIDALNIAIKAEAMAEDFYRDKASRAEEAELKELLLKLADEEHGHYNLLLAERNAIVGGFYWFDMDSSGFLED